MTDLLQEKADEVVDRSLLAAAEFHQFNQEHTDRIVEAVFRAGFDNRVRLAKMAHEETMMGVWEHKVIKNVLATQLVYESIRDEKTVGVISSDPVTGITEIAQPLGPVFAVIPVTNPTSTVMFKILICMKSRNPIIIGAPRGASKSCAEAVRICYEAALAAGAPEDCIQMISSGKKELTQMIMAHPKIALILATGATKLVQAAYSSGNPAIGVGPGNVPVYVDESADIPFAVSNIILSKTFDNGTICASEQAIVTVESVAGRLRSEFEKQGCYFLDPEEVKKVGNIAVLAESASMSPFVVGQPVEEIARKAGITVPEGTRVLIAPLEGIGTSEPLSVEVLAPILAFYVAKDHNAAVNMCIDLNYLGGLGHSACIYANDEARIMEFSELLNAGRVLVNTPTSQGAIGYFYNNLPPSLTLGCGTGGKNITTENITARNLLNIQRISRRRPNQLWAQFDTENYLNEELSSETIIQTYYKNR
jgi:acetaldehyde dehydrogenase/alcohol dehydrogenase